MDEYIYLYGLIPTSEANQRTLPHLQGFDGKGNLQVMSVGDITAIICKLDAVQYSEENIQNRIQHDMDWLHEKAFHHHETVMKISRIFTAIPLKFCVMFKNQASLAKAIRSNEKSLNETFLILEGNEEWNLKIYCDDQILKKQVRQNQPFIEEKMLEIKKLPKGRQYFEKKKLDKMIENELENEKHRMSERIHHQLKALALKGNVKNNMKKYVTGKNESMIWNSVYLTSEVEPFLEKIEQFELEMRESGWRFEATGPWPAYHFSSFNSNEVDLA